MDTTDIDVAAAQVDAAAQVLYDLDHPPWSVVAGDDRDTYLHVARKMLEAAAAVPEVSDE